MMSSRRMAVIGALVACVLAAPAVQAEPPTKSKGDPDEMICERQKVLGSRLAKRKVCMTRAQWEERRRDDRDLVHRSQTQQCVALNGVCSGAQ